MTSGRKRAPADWMHELVRRELLDAADAMLADIEDAEQSDELDNEDPPYTHDSARSIPDGRKW